MARNMVSLLDVPDQEIVLKFYTFDQVTQFVKKYEEDHFIHLHIANSRTIENARSRGFKRFVNEELKYINVKYQCIHGGIWKSRSTGKRRYSSFRRGCPFLLNFKVSETGHYFRISQFIDQHNHECTKEAYHSLPRQRQLDSMNEDVVKHLLDLGADKKLIKEFIFKKTAKKVKTKDLNNLKNREKRKKLNSAETGGDAPGSSENATSPSKIEKMEAIAAIIDANSTPSMATHEADSETQYATHSIDNETYATEEIVHEETPVSARDINKTDTYNFKLRALEEEHQMKINMLQVEHEMLKAAHEMKMAEHKAQMEILQLQKNIFRKVELAIDTKKINLSDIFRSSTVNTSAQPQLFLIQQSE